MSSHTEFDESAATRTATAPYTSRHPVPTVQGYEAHQEEQASETGPADHKAPGKNKLRNIIESAKSHVGLDSFVKEISSDQEEPYRSHNRNTEHSISGIDHDDEEDYGNTQRQGNDGKSEEVVTGESSSKTIDNEPDPRKKRRNMKHMERDTTGRVVTDPVTHLPVTIHDSTSNELNKVPENNLPPDGSSWRRSNPNEFSKSEIQRDKESEQIQAEHRGMDKLFPPPSFQATQEDLAKLCTSAVTFGLVSVVLITSAMLFLDYNMGASTTEWKDSPSLIYQSRKSISMVIFFMIWVGMGGGLILVVRGWLKNRVGDIWESQVWEAAKNDQGNSDSTTPESTEWLNSLLSSVWPLVNPDLFTSLADTLEDVMQASLPKLVRMISVEDLGQGSEAIRILGIRWLPTGAAAKNISVNGKIKSDKRSDDSDRKVPGNGELDYDAKAKGEGDIQNGKASLRKDEEDGDEENVAEGMEAEEGDFVNLEVAFAYRSSRSGGKSLKVKSKSAHLYLTFYLPGGIRFPVWVELRGMIGTMRMRLQLCPDPPFFALCTLTLLGQPKADLSCVPLTKKGLNIMDLPVISSFVQSSIDAALAEYVAPKSLTLDLKDMLIGDDFKKDTGARGVIIVRIIRARDFKEGDGSLGPLKLGSSDPYVAVGWAKFGKPVWSTRVLIGEMEPVWDETAFILVGREELNAEERLRVQLWDSDRTSADDDLGRIEVDLKELMHGSQSKGKMWERHDGFFAVDSDEKMPGSLDWSVGYYDKTRIQEAQLQRQSRETGITTIQQLKDKASRETERKMREAISRNESIEIDQQKAQDLKIREDDLIISAPPLDDYPTGIFSIQIHEITGLEFEKINKNRQSQVDDESDEAEGAGDLPSSYCTIILNHQKVFKTRTKPKNSQPFFNAGTERPIRDWRNTEIIVSVRDSRLHENDPLLGIVYLPLSHVFRERSQIIDKFPLVGGIGYGRARISMVFRSIQLQAPREMLGWDYGTLEITGPITSRDIPVSLRGLRLKLRTTVQRGKMYSFDSKDENALWNSKKDRPVRLAVRKRYCSCLVIEFRKNSLGLDKTLAFAVLWLKDIPDDEEKTVTLSIWKGDDGLKRAETNCINDLGVEGMDNVGRIKVPVKFWRGLSGYHQKYLSKSPNLQEVFEVLDTATANREAISAMDGDEGGGSSSSSSSSSSDDSDDSSTENEAGDGHHNHIKKSLHAKKKKISATFNGGTPNVDHKEGKRGPLDQVRDYKEHSDQLHRRNRGLMQWKGARTANWMKTKVQHGKEHVMDTFKHQEREPGVETEV